MTEKKEGIIEVYIGLFGIMMASFINHLIILMVLALMIIIRSYYTKMPIAYLIKRLKFALMFGGGVLLIPLLFIKGLDQTVVIFLKFFISIYTCIYLNYRVGIQTIFTALRTMKIPEIIIQIMAFNIRYLHVLKKELNRMIRARISRSYNKKRLLNSRDLQELAKLIGLLFIRSYKRSQRIYVAMESRGYKGD